MESVQSHANEGYNCDSEGCTWLGARSMLAALKRLARRCSNPCRIRHADRTATEREDRSCRQVYTCNHSTDRCCTCAK
eukprot:916643-Amphidinium_carterae.1